MQGLCYSYGGDKTKRRKLNSGLEPRVGLKNINAGQVGLQELLLQELTTHDLTSLEPFYATDIQYHQYQHYQNIYNQNTRKVVRLTEPDNGPAILLASREKHYCSEQVLDVARMPSGDGKAQLVFIGDAPVTDNPAGKKRKFDESHLETLAVALHTIDDHRRAVCSTDELDVQVTSHSGNSVAIELQRSDSQLSNIFNQIAQLPIDDSGIAPEEIQSYIGEQDPLTHKWSCLFPDCDKEFGRRENIRSHIQTHLGDRQYRCSSCGKRFVRQHDLKRHSKIHTGDKPHKCPCSAGFARQDALTRHRQRGVCIGGFPNAMRRQARRGRPRKKRLSSGETVEGIDRSYETSARIKSNGHQRLLSDFSGTMSFSDPLDDCLTLGFDENAFDSYSRLIHSDDVFETFTSLKADFGSDIVQNSLESFISKSADCKSVDLGSSPLRDACTRREGLDLAQTPSFSPLFSSSPLKLNDALSKTLSSQGSCDLHDIQFFTTPPLSPSISSVSTFGTTNVLDALSDNPSFPSMTDSSETMTDELSVRETESYLPLSEDDTVIALNWLDLL